MGTNTMILHIHWVELLVAAVMMGLIRVLQFWTTKHFYFSILRVLTLPFSVWMWMFEFGVCVHISYIFLRLFTMQVWLVWKLGGGCRIVAHNTFYVQHIFPIPTSPIHTSYVYKPELAWNVLLEYMLDLLLFVYILWLSSSSSHRHTCVTGSRI